MNSLRRLLIVVAVLMSAVFVFGCSDDDDDSDAIEDGANPTITMDGMTLYQTVVGAVDVAVTASDDVAIASVDVLVNGEVVATSTEAPFTVNWDTTQTDDGIVSVSVRATDTADKTAESEPVDIVVVNNGEIAELTDSGEGTIVIPDPLGTADTDVKHHWTMMDGGATRVIVIMEFEPDAESGEWQLLVDLGTGTCPHSGELLDTSEMGNTSPIVFDSQPDGGYPSAGTTHFVHVRSNAETHLGESMDYTLRVFTFI